MHNSEGLRLDVTAGRRGRRSLRLPLPVWLQQRSVGFNAGLVLLALIVLVTFAVPLVYRASTVAVDPLYQLAAPSSSHPLGTDQLGRDQLARVHQRPPRKGVRPQAAWHIRGDGTWMAPAAGR